MGGLFSMFGSESSSTQSNAAADNNSNAVNATLANVANPGSLLISGSNLTDSSSSIVNTGVTLGDRAIARDIFIEGNAEESLATLTDYLKAANSTNEAAAQANQSFFGDLIKKIGDLIKVKSETVTEDIAADADNYGVQTESKWKLAAGLGLAAVLLWLVFRKKRA